MRYPAHYRADIDGWRAVAVLAVIANHVDRTWLPGGYLGVDVFFVISGFVISMSLFGRKEQSFRDFIAGFYARRVRRLMPSLVACVLVTSVCVWLVDPAPRESLTSGVAALFGVSNFVFTLRDVDYFSRSTELNAFTHTWSLGVEEQFYLLFPLIVWFFAKREGGDSRKYVGVLAGAMAASFIVFALTVRAFPVFSYFQLPARFWELAAGALAFSALRLDVGRRLAWAPLIAVAALAVAFVLPMEQRVAGTALAVGATAALLVTTPASPLVHAAASWKALRFLGLISYPLYLWHWSVLAISRFTVGVSAQTIPFQLALTMLLAWGSYRYLETPVRKGRMLQSRRSALIAGLCVVVASAGFLLTLKAVRSIGPVHSASLEAVPPAFAPMIGSGEDFMRVCVVDGVKRPLRPDTIERCTFAPRVAGAPTIWTFGDSHAGQLQAMLYAVREATGAGVHLIETPNTPFPSVERTPASERGSEIFKEVSPRFRAGDIVLLARLYLERQGEQRVRADVPAWAEKVAALAAELDARGVRLVIFGPPPMFRFDTIQTCVRSFVASACDVERSSLEHATADVRRDLELALSGRRNVAFFESFPLLCPPSDAQCSPLRDGRALFRDKDHLNALGAASLAQTFVRQVGLERREP